MLTLSRTGWIVPLLLALASCALGKDAAPAADPAAFRECLASLPASARFKAVTAETFARHTRALDPDPSVLALLDRQPEFTIPVWDYLAILVDPERITDGRAAADQWHAVLQAIAARFGVPPATAVAVWGVESNFGRNPGGRPLLRSLGTLSCFGRRQAYFRGEFAAALRILQEGHIEAGQLTGSWAGAFGQTQFMPSTFLESAVDFDGDGRRDIVASVPDALASTASFLKNAGWRNGEPWGLEVRLPAGYDTSGASRKNKRPLRQWRAAGLTLADGRPLPDAPEQAGLLIPVPGGPAFLVGRNFDAIFRYNASVSYALAIGLLSDLVADRSRTGVVTAPWPTDDPGLSRAENRELQGLLLARGHDIGAVDGAIGSRTRDAIRAEQQRLGLAPDGRAGQRLLQLLRN